MSHESLQLPIIPCEALGKDREEVREIWQLGLIPGNFRSPYAT